MECCCNRISEQQSRLACDHTLSMQDYTDIIDTPMDLGTILDNLMSGGYESLSELFKDIRLVFTNSRTFNTNKRSQVTPLHILLVFCLLELSVCASLGLELSV